MPHPELMTVKVIVVKELSEDFPRNVATMIPLSGFEVEGDLQTVNRAVFNCAVNLNREYEGEFYASDVDILSTIIFVMKSNIGIGLVVSELKEMVISAIHSPSFTKPNESVDALVSKGQHGRLITSQLLPGSEAAERVAEQRRWIEDNN